MFCVVFEVRPKPDEWETYLGLAKMLRPELERIDGFIDNVRYKSLRRDGWVLSLSTWRDEKALVRWRTHATHHAVQEKGRTQVFQDYRLRVGQVISDTRVPQASAVREQRLDVTEMGPGTTITLIDTRRGQETPAELPPTTEGLVDWDVFEAILSPGDLVYLLSRTDEDVAKRTNAVMPAVMRTRTRQVRVIRSYGMFERREAPQYFPEAARN